MKSSHPESRRFVYIALAALFLSYAACVWAFVSGNEGWSLWTAAFVLYALLATLCFYGLRLFRKWAFYLSVCLALIALSFGFYAAHFAWNFWLFEEPSFTDRVLALLRPQIFLFSVVPVCWLLWISRLSNRRLFFIAPSGS